MILSNMNINLKKIFLSLYTVFLLFFLGFLLFFFYIFFYQEDIPLEKKSPTDKNLYKNYVNFLFDKNKDDFIPYKEYDADKNFDVKLIAIYLPQFHQFKENNEWHGKGFTEWTNVTKAKPLFEGHYQPQLPIDVGFYDLTHEDIMFRQIELAKNYGVSGFSFYYYWFSGKKLMEKPVYNFLNNKNLDFPFCISWANENWSKLWDGGNRELLMEQKFSRDDFENFAKDLLEFFKDDRYIKINNRPLFIIYRPALFEKELIVDFFKYLRSYTKKFGIEEPYIVSYNAFKFHDSPNDWGLDAIMEFHLDNINTFEKPVKKVDSLSKFKVYDMKKIVLSGKIEKQHQWKTFRTVFARWDNTPRKAYSNAIILDGLSPDIYAKWLQFAINDTIKNKEGDERLVFINAWNEWAEGAMLEPDMKYGYAYLDATRQVLENKFVYKNNDTGIVLLSDDTDSITAASNLANHHKGDRLLILGAKSNHYNDLETKEKHFKKRYIVPLDLNRETSSLEENAKKVLEWQNKHDIKQIYIIVPKYKIPLIKYKLAKVFKNKNIQYISTSKNNIWNFDNSKMMFVYYIKFLKAVLLNK